MQTKITKKNGGDVRAAAAANTEKFRAEDPRHRHSKSKRFVTQRHLFVDSDKDFTRLEDLGMWWGMACEWRNAKNRFGSDVSSDPRDYITSLADVGAAENKLQKGEQLRMLAHGMPGGTDIIVGKNKEIAKDKMEEISRVYKKKHGEKPTKDQLRAMHCFMAESKGSLEQMGMSKGGLGAGPLLIPSTGMVTFSGLDPAKGWSGGSFIDAQGYWKTATDAASELPELTKYKKSADDKSLLAPALDEVYAKINQEYIDFANACLQTGTEKSAWPDLDK